MPRARSSESAPVGIALTRTWAPSSPIRITVPFPNCRSIWVSAPCSAASRALAAFSSMVADTLAPVLSSLSKNVGSSPDGNASTPGGGGCASGVTRKAPGDVPELLRGALERLDGVGHRLHRVLERRQPRLQPAGDLEH